MVLVCIVWLLFVLLFFEDLSAAPRVGNYGKQASLSQLVIKVTGIDPLQRYPLIYCCINSYVCTFLNGDM